MKRKLLSVFLALCMTLTLVPTAVLAVGDDFVPTEQELDDAEKYKKLFAADEGQTWENLGNAALNYNYAKTYVENLEDGTEKAAAQARLDDLTTYYAGITELDMSGKKGGYGGDDGRHGCLTILTNLEKLNLSDTGITNVGPLQSLTKLKELNISDNPISDLGALAGLSALTKLDASYTDLDSNDFGALVGKSLTWLDLSGTDITAIGPITTNGNSPTCANTLEYLDVSNTGLTQLQEVWNGTSKSASLPNLTTLKAQGLSLTSISGLVEIVNADGFDANNITWDLSGSTLSDNTREHVQQIASKFSDGGFSAPLVEDNSMPGDLKSAINWKNKIKSTLEADTQLTWRQIINAVYWYDTATSTVNEKYSENKLYKEYISEIKNYYASVTKLDLSGQQISEILEDFSTADTGMLKPFTGLEELDLSNTGIKDTLGVLDYMKNLTVLDISGNPNLGDSCLNAMKSATGLTTLNLSGTGVTDIGGLVAAGVADTITDLNISNTKATKLESVWDKDNNKSTFPKLKTLTAHGLTLESISGLAEIVNATGFSANGITWDFGTEEDKTQSTVTDDGTSLAPVHVVMIRQAFTDEGTFNAPKTGANAVYSAINFQQGITERLNTASNSLTWDNVITAKYWCTTAKAYIDGLKNQEGVQGDNAKTALTNLMEDVDKGYAKITELDLSNKTTSNFDISTDAVNIFPNLEKLNLSGTGISDTGGLASLIKLETLDLSDNAGITDANLGALKDMSVLTSLDLSGTGITDVGGLVANNVAKTLTDLDISDTKVTKLESVWDAEKKASAFPALKTLTAKNLALTSISGLVEIATDPGFDKDGVTWNLGTSTLTKNATNEAHVAALASVLGSNFTAPTIETPGGGGSTGDGGSSGGGGGGGGGGSAVTTYTLTFDTNGGTAIAKVTKNKGTTINLSDYTTSREGYTFAGWYADEGLTDQVTSITLNANKTIYAKWTENVPVEPEPTIPFTDVSEGDWFYDAVCYVYENGMMNGVSETSFAPNATTSRAMIVTILYRLENEPAVSGSSFTDVPSGQWYSNAVAWAAENGIVNGVTATTFAPNSAITREQMAAILYRYAAWKGCDVSERVDLSGYADAASVSGYATEAMAWANAEGLITGVTDTTLRPAGSAVRAQAATILMRLCENVLA